MNMRAMEFKRRIRKPSVAWFVLCILLALTIGASAQTFNGSGGAWIETGLMAPGVEAIAALDRACKVAQDSLL